MTIPKPQQWQTLALIPLLTGLWWLLADDGGGWLFWSLLPGSVLLATGVAMLLMPGDPRITSYMALGGAVGVLVSPLAWWAGDFGTTLMAVLGSAASYLVAGRVGVTGEPLPEGVTPPLQSLQVDAKAGMDEAVLGYFVAGAQVPSGEQAETMCADALKLAAALESRGWLKDASGMHPAPPAPEKTWFSKARALGHDFEVLRFDSGFEPDDALPGAQLWKSYTANNRCAVRVLRHEGKQRPWLLCIHGYRMGTPLLDLSLFRPGWLHHKLGLNVVQPVLPLHGPRKIGLRTGDYYLDGDLLDLVYAEAQALWDLRRTIAWIRTQEENPRIGVLGYSLGGYNTALLSTYEKDLDFAVAGIPVVDFATALWRFIPPAHLRYFAARGLDEERYRAILSVVSPLARAPLLAREHLHIFAAAADRIVIPWHPLQLSRHWGVPVNWYQGSHLSVGQEREPRETLSDAIVRAGWPVG